MKRILIATLAAAPIIVASGMADAQRAGTTAGGPTITFGACIGNVTLGPGNTGAVNFSLPVVSSIAGGAFQWPRDNCKIVNYKAAAATYALPAPTAGLWVPIQNNGTGLLTLNAGSATINGAGAIGIPTGNGGVLSVDDTGSNYVLITAISGGGAAGVSSFNTRTGTVTLLAADVGAAITASAPAHQFFNALSAAGVFGSAQPGFGDLSGSAACGQLPALTGDVTSSACAATLATSGVAAGSYTNANVTVDAKGRVTSASSGSSSGVSVTARDAGTVVTPTPGTGTFTIGRQELIDARSTTSETISAASTNKLVTFSNTAAVAAALTSSAFASGQAVCMLNVNTGPVTVTPSVGTINALASVTLWYGQAICPRFDGTNWDDPSNGLTSFQDAITAHAGGGQASALALTKQINRITTVATTADSVALMPSVGGGLQIVINDATNATQLFGISPDTINGAATATGISLPAGSIALCLSTVAGKWACAVTSESGSGGSGITQLTGDVAAGPGSGSQAATIQPGVVTGSKIASSVALAGNPTATTQAANDNSTKIATTAYVDRATPLTVCTTSCTITGNRNYIVCTNACAITIPVPAAGIEICARNDDNVATVITINNPGSSAQFEKTSDAAYGTATTGTAVSGGAAGDKLCLLGRDATHYLVASFNGTWTMN